MVLTLEKIKELNLKVGTPIELDINLGNFIGKDMKQKVLGYFNLVDKEEKILYICDKIGSPYTKRESYFFAHIEDIKILDYKKQND